MKADYELALRDELMEELHKEEVSTKVLFLFQAGPFGRLIHCIDYSEDLRKNWETLRAARASGADSSKTVVELSERCDSAEQAAQVVGQQE